MRHASNEVVQGRCIEACRFYRFTMVFAQKHKGCAIIQAKWIKISSSNGSLKVRIYDIFSLSTFNLRGLVAVGFQRHN